MQEINDQLPCGLASRHEKELQVLAAHHDLLAMQIADIVARLQVGDGRMANLETELRANTGITTEVRDLIAAVKGGFKVLGWLGVAAKWLGAMAGAAVAIYTAWHAATHNGSLPK